jgi:hypothetical protein
MMILLIFLVGALVILFPFILGGIVGLVWGGIAKLGIPGKIIATLIMVVLGGMLGMIPLLIGSMFTLPFSPIIFVALVVASGLLIPVWYFFWHHDAVKEMGIMAFSVCLKFIFMIVWYGGGLGLIVSMFNQTVGACIASAAFVSGIVYYVIATRDSEEIAERDGSFRFRWIGIAIAAVLATVISIIAGTAIVKEQADLEAGVTYEANTKKQKELVALYPSGKTVICDDESFTGSFANLFTEPTNISPSIRELKLGEKFTTTGEVRFATKHRTNESEVWLQVNDNGTTGWINMIDLHWSSWPEGLKGQEAAAQIYQQIIGTWIDDEGNQWVFDNARKVKIGTLGSMDYTIIDDKSMTMTYPNGYVSEVDIQMSTDGKSLTLSYSNDGGQFTHKLTKR